MHYLTPMGKLQVTKLPMGVSNSPYIFQKNISELLWGLNMVCAYIEEVLVLTKDEFVDHLKDIEKLLQKLTEAGLKVNTKRSFFGCIETEYLSFGVSKYRVRPLYSNVESIK